MLWVGDTPLLEVDISNDKIIMIRMLRIWKVVNLIDLTATCMELRCHALWCLFALSYTGLLV